MGGEGGIILIPIINILSTFLFQRQYSDLLALAWEDELPISRRARKIVSNSLPINQNLHSSNEDSEVNKLLY